VTIAVYEVRPRSDKRGVTLISDALPFGALWYGEPAAIENAISYAKFYSRSHDAVIEVYDETGNVIETHEQGQLQRAVSFCSHHVALPAKGFPVTPLLSNSSQVSKRGRVRRDLGRARVYLVG
jgi:hypothetical protein